MSELSELQDNLKWLRKRMTKQMYGGGSIGYPHSGTAYHVLFIADICRDILEYLEKEREELKRIVEAQIDMICDPDEGLYARAEKAERLAERVLGIPEGTLKPLGPEPEDEALRQSPGLKKIVESLIDETSAAEKDARVEKLELRIERMQQAVRDGQDCLTEILICGLPDVATAFAALRAVIEAHDARPREHDEE